MRRGAQPPAHYEVELRQADQDGRGGIGWRAIKRVLPNGMVAPLKFGSVQAAQTHAGRLSGRETRIVAVERDGWRSDGGCRRSVSGRARGGATDG